MVEQSSKAEGRLDLRISCLICPFHDSIAQSIIEVDILEIFAKGVCPNESLPFLFHRPNARLRGFSMEPEPSAIEPLKVDREDLWAGLGKPNNTFL